uniref:ANAPC4_WD40 domain-containing protein n=1 Tax=Meloidogyne hapla TaxID=6305 RepID=A0A1I8BD60_MELHA
MFKGLLMGIELINDNLLFIAFEDSTICVLNLKNEKLIDSLKHPKYFQFICWCFYSNNKQTLIVISVIGQLYLLSYYLEELKVECILQKIKNNINYTSLAITNKDFKENPKIAAGLNNGEIQIFSLIPSNDQIPKWSKQINICLNIHCNSIQCLKWILINEEKEEKEIFIFSGSLDEKIVFLQLLNTDKIE